MIWNSETDKNKYLILKMFATIVCVVVFFRFCFWIIGPFIKGRVLSFNQADFWTLKTSLKPSVWLIDFVNCVWRWWLVESNKGVYSFIRFFRQYNKSGQSKSAKKVVWPLSKKVQFRMKNLFRINIWHYKYKNRRVLNQGYRG